MDLSQVVPHHTVTLPFAPELFPDARLYARAQLSAQALAQAWPTGSPPERAERRGLQRWITNARLDADALLEASADPRPLSGQDTVVLSAEDTSLCRAGGARVPRDAGPLRSSDDKGYLLHAAVAVHPRTGLPIAWLGAEVWTRPWALRQQDHKTRPLTRRESRKWTARRRRVAALLADHFGRPVLTVHLNDREGDCWASLEAAERAGDAVITRVAQCDRKVVEHRHGLRAWFRAQPITDTLTVTVAGKVNEPAREATVHLRWGLVTLRPPRGIHGRARRPLQVGAVWLHEPATAGVRSPIDVMLLTTLPLTTTGVAAQVARWYTARWAVEIAFDLLKNACALEAHAVTGLKSFKRLVALAGPTAVQVGALLSAARQPRPPAVGTLLDPAALRALRMVCRYHRIPTPKRWSVPSALRAIARLGGWEPRNDRPPGWRVVWRGWRRFTDLRGFADFLDRAPPSTDANRGKATKTGPP